MEKSILEVFGEKSKDSDDLVSVLSNALGSYKSDFIYDSGEIRRRKSEYPREKGKWSMYSYLEKEEMEALKALEPFMKELQSKKSKKWSNKSYEAAMDFAKLKGTNIDRHLIHSALEGLGQWANRSYEDKFGGTLGFYDDPQGKSKGNLISPLELNELLIEQDIAMEKPGYPERQILPPEMKPMGKGEAIVAKLASLLGRGK
tara:strand:+ start:28 stop:633 length:606 start_codon:yes stop_codon:yes gene_type:complete